MHTQTNAETTETTEAASAPDTQTQEAQETKAEGRELPEGYRVENEPRPVLAEDDEDLTKFLGAARTISEIANRNNWPLILAGFAPRHLPDEKGIACAFSAQTSKESRAETFACMGMPAGLLAAMAFEKIAEGARMMASILEEGKG